MLGADSIIININFRETRQCLLRERFIVLAPDFLHTCRGKACTEPVFFFVLQKKFPGSR